MKFFEPTGTIEVTRRSHGGAVARWKGGRVVALSGEIVREARRWPSPDFYAVGRDSVVVGGFRLLLLGVRPVPGRFRDEYLAMEDGALAACAKMYRDAALAFLLRFVAVEAYFRSYGIPELVEGELMPLTGWLAERLL